MNKIDRRHKYGIMLDTETANTIAEEKGKMDMRFVLPYDIGFAIIDSHAHIYETHSFVNSDIFLKETDLMKSAYYKQKIPKYWVDIWQNKRTVADTYTIRKFILDKIKEYNIQFICAHNARFDYRAMNNILRWTTKSKYRYFFPYGIEFWDTLKMAREVIATTPTYIKFCEQNNYMTSQSPPKPKLSAEILYKYISKNQEFQESHTGLEDVLIEIKILEYCMRKKKKMEKRLFPPKKE